MFFTPYFPAVFFATAFGGFRIGIATALAGGALGVAVNFSDAVADSARLALLLIFWAVCGLTIWGVEHYRTIVAQQRQIAKRLIEEEEYRKLIVDELQHRLKNKTSTIHAVLHQVLHDEPQVWNSIDHRIRALSATDDLIARVDGSGCDIKDLLRSELGPYGHVRFNLNGDPLFLPAKLAVSLALIFHELATNAGKYGAFSAANGMLQVSWSVSDDNPKCRWLKISWDETEGPAVENVGAARLRHQAAAIGAPLVRRQDRSQFPEDRRSLHDAVPHPRELNAAAQPKRAIRNYRKRPKSELRFC